jgi:hypothetical protein
MYSTACVDRLHQAFCESLVQEMPPVSGRQKQVAFSEQAVRKTLAVAGQRRGLVKIWRRRQSAGEEGTSWCVSVCPQLPTAPYRAHRNSSPTAIIRNQSAKDMLLGVTRKRSHTCTPTNMIDSIPPWMASPFRPNPNPNPSDQSACQSPLPL